MNKSDHVVSCLPRGTRGGRSAAASSNSLHRGCAAIFAAACLLAAGCADVPTAALPAPPSQPETQTLHAGDVLQIVFPAVPSMNTTQQIRRDGKINLYLIGEVQAGEMAPAQLQTELRAKYSTQLVSDEVNVTVVSSAFAVYVTGAVLHPGRITPNRDLTAFEAVMEAGGFDRAKANPRAVAVIRREGEETKNFRLDLQSLLEGKPGDQFHLKPNDVVYVPERISLF